MCLLLRHDLTMLFSSRPNEDVSTRLPKHIDAKAYHKPSYRSARRFPQKSELRSDRKTDPLRDGLYERIGGVVEVQAGNKSAEGLSCVGVDHPDSFIRSVPEKIAGGNVRRTETSLGLERNTILVPSGRCKTYFEISTKGTDTINLTTHHVHIVAFQCGIADEQGRHLT
jgi:hypothetical protein